MCFSECFFWFLTDQKNHQNDFPGNDHYSTNKRRKKDKYAKLQIIVVMRFPNTEKSAIILKLRKV